MPHNDYNGPGPQEDPYRRVPRNSTSRERLYDDWPARDPGYYPRNNMGEHYCFT